MSVRPGGSRAPRRAGRRPAADHGGPRLRPDDAAHGSFARADALLVAGLDGGPRPRREDIIRRPRSDGGGPPGGGHRGARGRQVPRPARDPGMTLRPTSRVPRLDTRLWRTGHPRRQVEVRGGRPWRRGRPLTVDDPRTIVASRSATTRTLDEDEVSSFVAAYARGDISRALAAAFLMACLLNGLDGEEILAMTRVRWSRRATPWTSPTSARPPSTSTPPAGSRTRSRSCSRRWPRLGAGRGRSSPAVS